MTNRRTGEAAREEMKTFLTEYIGTDGSKYGDRVYGDSWNDAQANADVLGLGTVIGELIMSIDTEELQ